MVVMDQITLGLDPLPTKTRKEVFLDEMNQMAPWAELVALIVLTSTQLRSTWLPMRSGQARTKAFPLRAPSSWPEVPIRPRS